MAATASLRGYNAVIDTVEVRGWTARLYHAKGRWTLDVHSGKQRIARARSGLSTPLCFQAMAGEVKRELEESGLVDG